MDDPHTQVESTFLQKNKQMINVGEEKIKIDIVLLQQKKPKNL